MSARLLQRVSAWWRNFRSVPEEFHGIRVKVLSNDCILLWDGDCGFCSALVHKIKRTVPRPFSEMPYQAISDRLPEDVLKWSTRQAHWVDSEGRVSGGSAAVVELLKDSGRPFLAGILGSAPFRPFLWLGYRLVAIHRGTLARFVK
jgi:predicted DCC family thiol-disulfide oxidoreductase YuxK